MERGGIPWRLVENSESVRCFECELCKELAIQPSECNTCGLVYCQACIQR